MPYDDPDPTDPQVRVGVVLPANEAASREMAYVLAEEFARMGFDTCGMLSLFEDPFYAGAHQIYQTLGADAVREIVEECVAVWGRSAARIQDNLVRNGECGTGNELGLDEEEFRIPHSEIRIANSGGA
jgi:hypothetical protein